MPPERTESIVILTSCGLTRLISWPRTSPRSAGVGALDWEKGGESCRANLEVPRKAPEGKQTWVAGWKRGWTQSEIGQILGLVPYFLWGKTLNLIIALLFIWVCPYHPHPCQTPNSLRTCRLSCIPPPMPFTEQVLKNIHRPHHCRRRVGKERRSHRKQSCQSQALPTWWWRAQERQLSVAHMMKKHKTG